MKKYLYIILLFISSCLIFSCQTYSDDQKSTFDQKIQHYIRENNLTMERLENGLYYEVIEIGDATELIKLNDHVTFSYKGSFLNGDVFQTISAAQAVSFKVNSLIVGWQDALSLIGNGGKICIIVPPHLAYGSKDTGIIPADSILIYELEVIDVT